MPERADEAQEHEARLPAKLVFKPPVSLEDLKADTERDPEGAEELVALVRTLRNEGSRPARESWPPWYA